MSQAIATIENAGVEIDHQAILKTLHLNPRDPNTQALLLVCERYGLDPLLKHMVLISGNPYITRDGYLAIAHRSGVFDGMEVLEQGSDGNHYTAKVAVYRKDMGRPFTFIGRYPKASRMAKDYGPEMAVKVAEVQALRRAFNVTGVGAADERWDDEAQGAVQTRTQPTSNRQVVDTPELPTAPPPQVDAETGEVVTKRRKPPTGAGGVGVAPDTPKFVPAEPLQVAAVTELIDGLKECGDEWLAKGREAWKAAKVPSVPADKLSQADALRAFDALQPVFVEAVKASPAPTLESS